MHGKASSRPTRKRSHRKAGQASVACELMRAGLLDVCLDCGQVYTHYRGARRKKKLLEHYKGYLWVALQITDRKKRPDSQGRRQRRMGAWVHRLALMKKRAIEQLFSWSTDHPDLPMPSSWRELVFDLSPQLDIDHVDLNRQNNRGYNLVLRTHAGNSSRRPLSPEEEERVTIEMREFLAS